MEKRGHQVLVIAATRSIGRKHTEIIQDKNIIRIVNNIPSRPLKQAEIEHSIHHTIQAEIEKFQPDIIHIEHVQFLSASILFEIPTLLTLHDAWFWCPAGGTLLRNGEQYCRDPSPNDCLRCTAKWSPIPTKTASFLTKIAGKLHPLVPASRLHALWQRVPNTLRSGIARQAQPAKPEHLIDLQHRNQQLMKLANHCIAITAPSQFLAELAQKQGMKPVRYIPNGVEVQKKHIGGAGFVFLGTMERHKGPHIVEKAYLSAFSRMAQKPPIHFYGQGSLSVSLPHSPPISREQVFQILQKADCLLLGSIWPENAPMIILEARACGCPVIAPKIGGIPELIQDGIDGLLYRAGDISDLAQKMVQSLRQNFSPRQPPHQESILDQYEQLYQDISS